ncbi:hypothetical protein E6C60_1176 [Paenibacillus algicola]|uniref:Uncharacterized protein n=1 Tax=Paenibacillus algicola TaxID=2565926 RepID=A0A4V1G3P3_9BACL|nr:hypothetical protein [Paenibacillus algicola]QCT01894.1 hypothetical protein E6C60_1176 [Paenibacillus algicola]
MEKVQSGLYTDYKWSREHIAAGGFYPLYLLAEWGLQEQSGMSRSRGAGKGLTNLQLHIKLDRGVQLITALGSPLQWVDRDYAVMAVGSLRNDLKRQAILQLQLEGRASGQHSVLQLYWSYRDDYWVQVMTPAVRLHLQFSNHTSVLVPAMDTKVDKYLRMLQNPLLLERAFKLFERGKARQGEDLICRRADEMLLCALRWNDAELLKEAEWMYALARQWSETYAVSLQA